MKKGRITSNIIWLICLIIVLGFIIFPFLQMLFTSLKGTEEQFAIPISFFPKKVTLINFKQALGYNAFIRYFINSLIVSTTSTVIILIIALLGAYGFTRLNFPGRRFFLAFIIFSQMFCLAAIVVPIYRILGSFNLINSYKGLILCYIAFSSPTAVWLFRSFLLNIPVEMEEAALTEGATKLGAFFRVVIPLLRPAIGAVGSYVFFLSWQEFLFALIIMTNKEHRTLPIGIMDFVGQYETNWGNLMAASILITIPVFLLFLFLQQQLIAGLTEGAIKG